MQALFSLVTKQPQLLAAHADAYSDLIVHEVNAVSGAWRNVLLYSMLSMLLGTVGGVLTGVALMLWAVMPLAQAPMGWLLWATPLAPLVLALACAQTAKSNARAFAFADLRQQFKADMSMLSDTRKMP